MIDFLVSRVRIPQHVFPVARAEYLLVTTSHPHLRRYCTVHRRWWSLSAIGEFHQGHTQQGSGQSSWGHDWLPTRMYMLSFGPDLHCTRTVTTSHYVLYIKVHGKWRSLSAIGEFHRGPYLHTLKYKGLDRDHDLSRPVVQTKCHMHKVWILDISKLKTWASWMWWEKNHYMRPHITYLSAVTDLHLIINNTLYITNTITDDLCFLLPIHTADSLHLKSATSIPPPIP